MGSCFLFVKGERSLLGESDFDGLFAGEGRLSAIIGDQFENVARSILSIDRLVQLEDRFDRFHQPEWIVDEWVEFVVLDGEQTVIVVDGRFEKDLVADGHVLRHR